MEGTRKVVRGSMKREEEGVGAWVWTSWFRTDEDVDKVY